MKILAIDCVHEACSAAFFDGEKIVSEIVEKMEHGQAERLIPMIQEVLSAGNVGFQDIEAIAVTTGPGSFTGVRVGLAAANGIALAADLPMIGVSVLEVLAWKSYRLFPDIKKLCLVLETKRDDYYIQFFEDGKSLAAPEVLQANAVKERKEFTFAGNAVDRLIKEIGSVPMIKVDMPSASDVALFANGRKALKEYPEPLYLREAEVSLCRK